MTLAQNPNPVLFGKERGALDGSGVTDDPGLRRFVISSIDAREGDLPADSSPPTLIVVLSLGWLLLYLNYLRQHLAGIKALDDDPAERPLLTFGLNLAAVIFPPAVLIIVYRSQVVLNWAIARSLANSDGFADG